ncbi:hypothetical protein DFP73DRAFT_592317 [Morchella snyderi]|nr:hypothetical protein DFP73DRAFT_592317 [Morchella snyderi]
MLILKSFSAATASIPLFRAYAPAAGQRLKGLSVANVVFPPPETAKEFEMSFAGTMVCPPAVAGDLTMAATAVTAKAAAVYGWWCGSEMP